MAQQAVAVSLFVPLQKPPVVGTILITGIDQTNGTITISGSGEGWTAVTDQGVSIINLKTSLSNYPISYALTFSIAASGFSFAQPPVGEISLVVPVTQEIQQSGFLIVAPVLNMYHDTITGENIKYNLALQFTNLETGVSFWVGDPTIVFEPPNG